MKAFLAGLLVLTVIAGTATAAAAPAGSRPLSGTEWAASGSGFWGGLVCGVAVGAAAIAGGAIIAAATGGAALPVAAPYVFSVAAHTIAVCAMIP